VRGTFLEDLSVGQSFGSGSLRVEADDIIRFAQLYDPQPFHLDPELAAQTLFGGLAASGWHTAALTMRLLVDGEFMPAGGFIGAGIDEIFWPIPVRPGDTLHVTSEILALRRSHTRPMQGVVKALTLTKNQKGQTVQRAVVNLIVKARSAET
jgi:acyl dehydratase